MFSSRNGGSATPDKSKPFTVSFSNATRKPPAATQDTRPRVAPSTKNRHQIISEDSEEDEQEPIAEEVTGFDIGGAIKKNASSRDNEPLVIKVESRNNWRDRPGVNRRGRNLLPQEVQAAGNVAEVETETPNMSYGLSLATTTHDEAEARISMEPGKADMELSKSTPPSESKTSVPLTQDEIALQALIRETQGDQTRRSDLVIESNGTQGRYDETSSFRADVATRPDQASLDAYEAVPVEEFGAALLRGMGWKEGQAIGRGNYGNSSAANQAHVPQRRPGFLGIGAKDIAGGKGAEIEIGAWGKAAMRKGSRKAGEGGGSTVGVYMPVVMKSKVTGEHITEEEFKTRQRELSERKTDGKRDDGRILPSLNERDPSRSRHHEIGSDSDRDRSRRTEKHSSRRDRSRSAGSYDRRNRRHPEDDHDDGRYSSRDRQRYRDRYDSDTKNRPRSRDPSHRDSEHSRRDRDHRRDNGRHSERVRSHTDRDRDRRR